MRWVDFIKGLQWIDADGLVSAKCKSRKNRSDRNKHRKRRSLPRPLRLKWLEVVTFHPILWLIQCFGQLASHCQTVFTNCSVLVCFTAKHRIKPVSY